MPLNSFSETEGEIQNTMSRPKLVQHQETITMLSG